MASALALQRSTSLSYPFFHAFSQLLKLRFTAMVTYSFHTVVHLSTMFGFVLNFSSLSSMVHFTVVCLVTWSSIGSEAGVGLVLIEIHLLSTCKSCCSRANQFAFVHEKHEVCIKTRSTPVEGQVTKHASVKWTIPFKNLRTMEGETGNGELKSCSLLFPSVFCSANCISFFIAQGMMVELFARVSGRATNVVPKY